ncbi:MAG: DUF2911 domain-containing protein [Gemmatimonadales bacterium]|nr:DUF2911 domain-containing protein [Gemmatimonadales bacterium]
MTRVRLPALTLLAVVGLAPALRAQVRASEPASVSQTVDGTKITIEYSRPRARGRELFGKVVYWGEVWTPGANMATTIDVSKDVTLNGTAVPKGKYSVWIVVRQSGDWTFVLDPRASLFHVAHPDSTAQQIRFPIRPGEVPFTESLTWSFQNLRVDGVTLAMDWGKVRTSVDLAVTPSYNLKVGEEHARPLVGTYDLTWLSQGAKSKTATLVIVYENGRIRGEWTPVPYPEWEGFYLIAAASGEYFFPAFTINGQLADLERSIAFYFTMEGGKAVAVRMQDGSGAGMATGKRKG